MSNVVREDVVQISFDVINNPCQEIANEYQEMKNTIAQAVSGSENSLKNLASTTQSANSAIASGASAAAKSVAEIGDSCNEVSSAAKAVTAGIEKFDKGFDAAKSKASEFASKVKEIASAGLDKITHPIQTIKTALGNAKEAAAGFVTKLKDIGRQKVSGLTSNIKQVKNALTQGQTGAKGFTTALKNVGKISVSGAVSGIKNIASHAKTGATNLKKLAETKLNSLKSNLGGVDDKLKSIADRAKSAAASVGRIALKGIGVGALAGVTAATALTTQSVKAFANYEQLEGGVQTLFGAGGRDIQEYAESVHKSVDEIRGDYNKLMAAETDVLNNARVAYRTAGLSANDYMDTVTSFSASLIASVGGDTQKAAALADQAIIDMSDNANKMGTDMQAIQTAYQGFAKQNYTMLDNLKLGYGGTKTEMERLLKDAEKLQAAQGETVKYSVDSYADIVEAIHAVQENLDITGTTAKEAATTISGSLSSTKAAWNNLLVDLVRGGDNFDESIANLIESAKTFGKNLIPAIRGALTGIGSLVEGLAPIIAQELPGLVDELLPPLISAALALVKGLIVAIPNIIKVLIAEFPNIAKQLSDAFMEAFGVKIPLLEQFGNIFTKNAGAIAKSIPYLIGFIGIFKLVKGVFSKISAIKGGLGGSSGDNAMDGFLAPFKSLAKAKPTTILKGIANLAIIVGGLTVLAIALMALAPHVAKLTDIKSIMKLIAIIGVLGVVGSALAVMAGFVGNIPVSSVALGLANIAIIVAGMSALFLLIGAVSLLDFDYNKILEIIKIIAILGAVGSVLSVFAGIVGLIPIPVVLAGLANIALVLAGLTAIIVAFGALSEIPGFNDFIAKGGETLAQLFGVIGNIVGSLIGGVGEGISNSLPKIGENLSAFAEALKPMFEIFNGADMGGIGSFFSAIGGFVLMMTGNDILSFFTGGIDFAGIGNDLTSFANNAEGFFTKIATFPDNSFTNAAALFQSLADIGNIPCTGGIAQWFTGTIDFNGLAEGLKQLASDDVLAFFTKIAGLPTEGFENTKALFQSLADIGNIPCTGGIAQWFSGTLDFDGLTQKLPPFGTAMAEFFAAIAPINDFEKIKSLFEALGGLEDAIPNSGGVAQWFTGENDISGVGESLKKFGNDTKDFFAQVNGLNVGKLNGLWDTIKKAGEAATTNLTGLAGKGTELTNFMNNAKGFFSGAGEVTAQIEAVNSVALALQNFFGVIATIVDTSLTNINTGLQTTVTLIQASTGYFNSFGIAIIVSCNSGAAAFIFLQTTITTSVDGMRVTVTSGFASMASTIKRKCSEINTTVSNTASRLKSAFNGINLTSVGANIVQGLLNGMKSKSTGLLSYVNQLAQSISKTMRTALDEHSPSKVMYQIGEFAVQGLVNGIVDTTPKAQKSADNLAQTYTPEDDSAIYNNSSSTQNTTYAPVFNLTISGSNSDRELARKIRSWVRDEVNNINESMLRRSEPVQII